MGLPAAIPHPKAMPGRQASRTAKVGGMPNDVLAPLTGPALRISDAADLEAFLSDPGAELIVRESSFEQVFFTIKALGLADATGLLPHVTPTQVRGFVDLDCWRKDSFVPGPFMQWIAGFVQVGPEATARALSGIDEDVVALFLKDLIEVFEIERDEPPPERELTFTPDGSLAVGIGEKSDAASIAALILDALFRFDPDRGFRILRRVRYVTRVELEETAYQNKTRRLDVHGFVDYYEALSIYASPEAHATTLDPRPASGSTEPIPGDTGPQPLPTVFAETLADGSFLMEALADVETSETARLADELTALGNRILSANLVNLGEVGGIRNALGEMKDFLTIGLESLTQETGMPASRALETHHIQTLFRTGFGEIARLRLAAERLVRIPGFRPELLESPDVEFLGGAIRFKPLLWEGERFRNFQSLREVRTANDRIQDLESLISVLLGLFPDPRPTLRQTFNTAVVRQAISGLFEPVPLSSAELEAFVGGGLEFPSLELPERLLPLARGWLTALRRELEPLAGQRIDPRFVGGLHMRL